MARINNESIRNSDIDMLYYDRFYAVAYRRTTLHFQLLLVVDETNFIFATRVGFLS
jgi:hypothetical protein